MEDIKLPFSRGRMEDIGDEEVRAEWRARGHSGESGGVVESQGA